MNNKKFKKKVHEVVKRIPPGVTFSYKEVAKRAGNRRACRAVGKILSNNKDTSIPCHRVIRADGSIGGYNEGMKEKIKKLRKEGAM